MPPQPQPPLSQSPSHSHSHSRSSSSSKVPKPKPPSTTTRPSSPSPSQHSNPNLSSTTQGTLRQPHQPSAAAAALPSALPSASIPIPIPDSPPSSLPLPLSASLLLTSLPRDASSALTQAVKDVDGVLPLKVTIRLHPIGSAPALRQKVFRVSASNRFETVVAFLRRKLRVEAGVGAGGGGGGASGGGGRGAGGEGGGGDVGSVFCYVNNVFAPGLDEGVGGLWRCFKTDDQLLVGYSMTPAFG